MKRLLLSTVILFGTLSGVNAADAGEFKPACPEDTELTEMGGVLRSGGGISPATAEALAASGVGAPIAVDYQRGLKEAFINLDEAHPIINREALSAIHDSMIEVTSIHELDRLDISARERRIEEVIVRYFNEVIDYLPFSWGSYASLSNLSILGTLAGAHTVLIAAGNVYPALAPLTGGLTLASINLLTTGVSLYIKDYGWPKQSSVVPVVAEHLSELFKKSGKSVFQIQRLKLTLQKC